MESYASRLAAELAAYTDQEEVHDLPEIYHYWSARHCTPLLEEVGVAGLDGLWDDAVAAVCAARAPASARLVSLGAGNGDVELGIAGRLAARGLVNLDVVLLELNPAMLARARAEADRLGLGGRVACVQADLNAWRADGPVDVYFANHSLHHVVELEHLLGQVRASLVGDGVLLVNDMIGRNGHRRWPEAAGLVEQLWRAAPERCRFNHYTGRVDRDYPDVDCSSEGFEGVRAQDILPLLLDLFHPEVYVTFANVIDPFVDRVYGPNFDPADPDDAAFIDRAAAIDDAAIDLAITTPTHLVATFRTMPVACRFPRGRSPARTLRVPDSGGGSPAQPLQVPLPEPDSSPGPDWRGRYVELRGRRAVRLALAAAAWRHRRWREGLSALRPSGR